MIYETIPAHYFDHTDLLKAIIASKVLSKNANHWAYLATEELMEEDLTSGQAFEAGNMINILKNVECAVDYWKKIFINVAKNKFSFESFCQKFCCVHDESLKARVRNSKKIRQILHFFTHLKNFSHLVRVRVSFLPLPPHASFHQ